MNDNTTPETPPAYPAVVAQLVRHVRPVAYRLRDAEALAWLYYSEEELHAAAKTVLSPLYDQATIDAAVAAERERWETEVCAYLTACDESWAEVCELAAKHGVTSVQIGPKQAAGMTALAALREFCGPNAHIDLAR